MMLGALYKYVFFAGGALFGLLLRSHGLPLPYPATGPVDHVDPSLLPNPAPFEGVFTPNTLLRGATRLFEGVLIGSESVAVDSAGALVMCDRYGAVWRAVPNAQSPGGYKLDSTPLAHLGPGRPLGFHLDHKGDLVVCNAGLGLVKQELSGSKRYEILAVRVSASSPLTPNTPLNYVNDLDIASDGTIYFTDSGGFSPVRNRAGFWDTMEAFLLIAFQGTANGRLLKYSPATRETVVLAEGFFFPNGVALSADESFVAFTETIPMRVWRYWLSGPKQEWGSGKGLQAAGALGKNQPARPQWKSAGKAEVLLDQMAAHPDGISRAPDGTFWVAGVAAPNKLLSFIMPYRICFVGKYMQAVTTSVYCTCYRFLRFVVAWIPSQLKPIVKKFGLVFQINSEGHVLRALMDPDGSHVSSVSALTQVGDRLFLGNLAGSYLSYLDLDTLPAVQAVPGTRSKADREL